MGVTRPTAQGGTISVSDSASLATMDTDGLPLGSTVWNIDVGAAFKLTEAARTVVALDAATDGYATSQWTIAAATFTGREGDTLQIVLNAPNQAFSANYAIDTVDSTHVVTVIDPPTGATNNPYLAGSVVIFDDALVTDSVVSAAGQVGVRWVVETSGGGAVESVTGAGVDNTDPANPVISAPILGLDWVPQVHAAVYALDNTITRVAAKSEMVNLAGEVALIVATGSGVIANSTTVQGGGSTVSSGGTNGGLQIGYLGTLATGQKLIANARTSHYAIYARVKVLTGPTNGSEQMVMAAVFDGTNDFCLGNNSAQSTANFTFGSHGGTPSNTGVAFGSVYRDLLIWNNGTNLNAYINTLSGTPVGTLLSSTIASAAGSVRVFSYNGDQLATLNFSIVRWACFTSEAT